MRSDIFSSPDRCLDAVEHLNQLLALRGWRRKAATYRTVFKSRSINSRLEKVNASAIVVSHRVHPDTENCLRILQEDIAANSEVIFVSNGVRSDQHAELHRFCDVVVQLGVNTGAYVARNIGALFASGPILIFVDDDCIPYRNLVSAHLEAHTLFNCISVRGVYEPKTANPLNALAAHYDLGDEIFPQHVVAEGNASYQSDLFYKVGGWDDEIRFGGGGTDLAFRLLQVEPDMRRQIYYPKARIRHDYAVHQIHLAQKRRRQEKSFTRLQIKHGEYRMAKWLFRKYLPGTNVQLLRSYFLANDSHAIFGCAKQHMHGVSVTIAINWRQNSCFSDLVCQLRHIRNPAHQLLILNSGAENLPNAPDWLQILHPTSSKDSMLVRAIEIARGDIILLVDSATELSDSAVRCHIDLHQEFDVIAVQGAVEIPEDHTAQDHQHHPQFEFPALADRGVNISYRRTALLRVSRAAASLNMPLSLGNIVMLLSLFYPDARKQIYSPRPIVRPEFAVCRKRLEKAT
jgi:glycosyltransferase involved in cell wall biosynthesis